MNLKFQVSNIFIAVETKFLTARTLLSSSMHINVSLFLTFMPTQYVHYARERVDAFTRIPRTFVAVEEHLHNRTANREVPALSR